MNLEATLEKISAAARCQLSWVVHDVRHDREIAHSSETPVPASSTRKLSILMATLSAAERGEFSLNDRTPIPRGSAAGNRSSGCIQYLESTTSYSIMDLLTLMIIVSDNVATKAIIDLIGLDAINRYCTTLGLEQTIHRLSLQPPDLAWDHSIDLVNTTSAADMARLLRLIVRGATGGEVDAPTTLGSAATCQLALTILQRQQINTPIKLGLPPNVVSATKHGVGIRNLGDVGVVYDENGVLFVMSVFADGVPEHLSGRCGHHVAAASIAHLAYKTWLCLSA